MCHEQEIQMAPELNPTSRKQKRDRTGGQNPNKRLSGALKGENLRFVETYVMLSAFFLSTYCFH
jgi:hypothetical protein